MRKLSGRILLEIHVLVRQSGVPSETLPRRLLSLSSELDLNRLYCIVFLAEIFTSGHLQVADDASAGVSLCVLTCTGHYYNANNGMHASLR